MDIFFLMLLGNDNNPLVTYFIAIEINAEKILSNLRYSFSTKIFLMESYLNLAHRSHRKAEHYNSCHLFDQAIFHFNKAVEYLENSIRNTTCDDIRTSLIVQQLFCLGQIDLLKKRISKRINKKDTSAKSNQPSHHSGSFLVISTSKTLTMSFNSNDFQSKYADLYNAINEQESLLNGLIKDPIADLSKTQTKETLVQEMKTLNEKLKNLFGNLVENLDQSQKELQALKKENQSLRKEIVSLKNDKKRQEQSSNKLQGPFPELPPLEPPTLLY